MLTFIKGNKNNIFIAIFIKNKVVLNLCHSALVLFYLPKCKISQMVIQTGWFRVKCPNT